MYTSSPAEVSGKLIMSEIYDHVFGMSLIKEGRQEGGDKSVCEGETRKGDNI